MHTTADVNLAGVRQVNKFEKASVIKHNQCTMLDVILLIRYIVVLLLATKAINKAALLVMPHCLYNKIN